MKALNLLLAAAAIFLFSSVVYAKGETYKDAEKLLDAGEYTKAEDLLKKLISAEPKKASYHQLLGDVYKREGRHEDALSEYEKAKTLGGENPELLKSMGTVQKRMRRFEKAKESYEKAVRLNPKDEKARQDVRDLKSHFFSGYLPDEEARQDIRDLELKRGLTLKAWVGGWEPDYTKEAYEGMLSYGGFSDRLDLNVGYGYSIQTYYKKSKVYASGYFFYRPDSYFKVYLAQKGYYYPTDPKVQKPNPDSNSYDIVHTVELEASHWFIKSLRGSLAYEHFRPNFFYDKNTYANNHKVSAELYYLTPFEPLGLKLIYAILMDPDSKKTEIKGRDNPNTPLGIAASTDIQYQTQSLLGGAVELAKGKWSGEVKYMPNRDLDSSYEYSILADAAYDFTDRMTGRLDYVYDKYSSVSFLSGKTANVYLASIFYRLNPSIDLGVGYKFINLPTQDDNTGFLSITYKTGLGG